MDYENKRVFKRIVVAAIYLLVLIGAGFLVFLLQKEPPPSCFDTIKNQEEEGIDCGGPCKSCEDIKKLRIFEAVFIPTKEGFVDVAAEVQNDNLAFGVPQLKYTFELYDRDNAMVGSKYGTAYLLPNSTKFVIDQAIKVSKPPKRVKFYFSEPQFKEVKEYIKPRLNILSVRSKVVPEGDIGSLVAEGNVINQTNFNLDKVIVMVLLKDDAGEIIAVNRYEVRTILANENRFFSTRWFYRVPNFAKIETSADTNIFEESNYLGFIK